ncbi:Cro/CI family transcriptional regulator [uncultured Halomonas sp.]|uniref:transcriptional regulator n=1 Tax=uncultured Halomonas sp. TaxID=173971 RepID=UPI00345B2B51
MNPKQALEKACELMGGQSALARACGVTPQAVQIWVATGRCPARRAAEIERATWGKVRCEQLRPDLYAVRPAQTTV